MNLTTRVNDWLTFHTSTFSRYFTPPQVVGVSIPSAPFQTVSVSCIATFRRANSPRLKTLIRLPSSAISALVQVTAHAGSAMMALVLLLACRPGSAGDVIELFQKRSHSAPRPVIKTAPSPTASQTVRAGKRTTVKEQM